MVEKLHAIGFDINARNAEKGGTALYAAIFEESFDAAKKLLELGADSAKRCTEVRFWSRKAHFLIAPQCWSAHNKIHTCQAFLRPHAGL